MRAKRSKRHFKFLSSFSEENMVLLILVLIGAILLSITALVEIADYMLLTRNK